MKITIKTTPESIGLELSEIEGEELKKNCDLIQLGIRAQPGFNPETSSLELEVHSVDEFEDAMDELLEAIETEITKAEKS